MAFHFSTIIYLHQAMGAVARFPEKKRKGLFPASRKVSSAADCFSGAHRF